MNKYRLILISNNGFEETYAGDFETYEDCHKAGMMYGHIFFIDMPEANQTENIEEVVETQNWHELKLGQCIEDVRNIEHSIREINEALDVITLRIDRS